MTLKSTGEPSVGGDTVRLLMLGAPQVGKSALIVKFFTKRFIGEYDSNQDRWYSKTCLIGTRSIKVDVLDTCCEEMPDDNYFLLADACVIVYSVTDISSFTHAWRLIDYIQDVGHFNIPILLLANKSDLHHQCKVNEEEASKMAAESRCQFAQVSAAEDFISVHAAFQKLLLRLRWSRKQNRSGRRRRRLSFQTIAKVVASVVTRAKNAREQTNTDSIHEAV